MASPKKTPARKKRAVKQPRKCGGCGQLGHDRRNCPVPNLQAARPTAQNPVIARNGVEKQPPPPPIITTIVQDPSLVDFESILYVVLDLETTGRSRQRDEIIELAAQVLDPNGIQIEDAVFTQLVRPNLSIPAVITQLTTIDNDMVRTAERFPSVAHSFVSFMQQQAEDYGVSHESTVDHIVLVAHNGKVFDIPFFAQQLCVHGMEDWFFEDRRFGFAIDSLQVARKAIKCSPVKPTAFNLATLYQFVTGKAPAVSHRALADVTATCAVLRSPIFWETRKECIFSFRRTDELVPVAADAAPLDDSDTSANKNSDDAAVTAALLDDSDTSASSDDGSQSTGVCVDSDETDEDDSLLLAAAAWGDRWETKTDYRPSAPLPFQRFEEHFTSVARSRRQMTGLQCSPIDVNTPIRAWREIFKTVLLEKIVRYTNDYGRRNAKHWSDITRKDLEAFIAVLFVSAIQKRKDKPSNWFAENRILESRVVKKIMSGRKFFLMLRYLHCCAIDNQPASDASDYDPAYKIAEMRDYLEDRYTRLFTPGQQLSLDETLIRAFGRIKFKVRIVTKAARYGIKVYVVTDAVTAFVLRVLIYTGKSTYASTDQQDKLKTVQVVNKLVEPFIGTHRTIYVDRFYTSLDLLKSLAEKNLYVTGTMLANRIPQAIRIPKTSFIFRQMKRGDCEKSRVRYKTKNGEICHAGLVAWRDRNIVYCLSNDTNNFEFDECRRRGEGGIIQIPRPLSISNYNRYMGGVDLADMRRLHCNSTIMCQNRWWLKLFFYLLDVGTSNALVLYNESCRMRSNDGNYTPTNIVNFKMQLVECLAGRSLDELFADEEVVVEHIPVHLDGGLRSRCAYCSLTSVIRRTRYKCKGCGVPLCSIGSGRVENDCFTNAHESEQLRQIVCKKYEAMKKIQRII